MKGFGFVTFENSQNAEEARKNLHLSLIDGRTIEVCILYAVNTCYYGAYGVG